jgi:hypothetical protein
MKSSQRRACRAIWPSLEVKPRYPKRADKPLPAPLPKPPWPKVAATGRQQKEQSK